jgi:hypothetical protein
MAVRFRVFGGAEVGNWGLKCLGSQKKYFMDSLEVNEGKKK